MGKLDGRVALVTGGAQGMGAAHARILAEAGASVVVCDLKADEGAAVADSVGGVFHQLDVTDEQAWSRVVSDVQATLGPISILVNNAGISALNRVQDTPTEEWNRLVSVNLNGAFFGIRAITPSMRAAGGGVIVNVSSAAGLMGGGGMAAYLTTKWAVRGLTKAAALDLANDNIRVVSLHPGLVRTEMSSRIDLVAHTARQPIPRPAEPEELARMLLFIVADATYSTGSEFVADGGLSTGLRPG